MKNLLAAVIKLAMDANYSDAEIAKLLKEAAVAVGSGAFFGWSQK